ncbi:MAG: choice-of-anchor D domain-containing protein [Candidatus Kapaibacteriota bacterium]
MGDAQLIVNDEFESYPIGSFPSTGGWYERYNGANGNRIVNDYAYSGSKSFYLLGVLGWSAVIENHNTKVNNDPIMSYEYYIRTTGGNVSSFYDYSPIWGWNYAGVSFETDGWIYSFNNGQPNKRLMPYSPDSFYKVRVVADFANGQYSIWINNVFFGSNFVISNDASYNVKESYFTISSGHAQRPGWYDDVKVWRGSLKEIKDTSDSLWAIILPELYPYDVDIGTTCVGSYKDTVLRAYFTNDFKFPITVDSINITGPNASDFYIVSGYNYVPFILQPGEKRNLEIGFHPSAEGLREANLSIYVGNYVITKKLSGRGVARNVDVTIKNIVFPDVELRKSMDTTITAVIINRGPAPVLVLSTKLIGPDQTSFTIVSGGGSFTLNSGEQRTITIRFSPKVVGRVQCYLEFETANDCQNPIVELFGKGVKCFPMISAPTPPPINLVCEVNQIDSVKISNPGCDTLKIHRAEFIGDDADAFSFVQSFQPFYIEPDSSDTIFLEFKPKRSGPHKAILVVYSNADPDSIMTIPLNGLKEIAKYSVSVDTINLGYLCPNETKDTLFGITNTGTIPLGIRILADNNLQLSGNNLFIDTNQAKTVLVQFNGLPTEGKFTGKVVVADTICLDTKEILIEGEISLPKISVPGLEIEAVYGSSQEGKLQISNTGKRAIEITSIEGIIEPFELLEASFPMMLPPNETKEFIVRYNPDDRINDTIFVRVNFLPCLQNVSINLVGIPKVAFAKLKTLELEGFPGDKIKIPVILSEAENLFMSGVQSINVDLEFNHTLLYPIGFKMDNLGENRSKIRIENLLANKDIGNTLAEIEFAVGLGNSESCELILSNPETRGGVADVYLVNGTFKLLGICREGGPRLVNPLSRSGILNIVPNPAEESVEIEVSLNEVGWTELALYNTLGEKVKEIMKQIPQEQGVFRFSVNTAELNKGVYMFQLRTPTLIEGRVLIIK